MKQIYGYMRVSTVEQNTERQHYELLKWGVSPEHIYCDKLSGKNFERPQYQLLKSTLQAGDVVVVTSLDRLGRAYTDIQEEWRDIVRECKAHIVVLDMPLLDTRQNNDLIGTLISDIVLQLLSYVAETERQHIRQRQAEGIAVARRQGKHLGRQPLPIPTGFYGIYEDWRNGNLTLKTASHALGVTIGQFRTMVRKYTQA